MAGTNILLVDDLRHFKAEAIDPVFNPGGGAFEEQGYLRICRSSQSAVETLGTDRRSWDQIWLDHDLGIVNGAEDTTMPVIDYIVWRHEQGDPISVGSYVIHSSNGVGVQNIAMALSAIGEDSVIVNARDFLYVPEESQNAFTDLPSGAEV